MDIDAYAAAVRADLAAQSVFYRDHDLADATGDNATDDDDDNE